MSDATHFLPAFRAGEAEAANELTRQYFARVVRAAERRLAGRGLRASGPEDVAASVFESLWDRAAQGGFSDEALANSDELWRLLCHMVQRKVIDHARRERAAKRGGGQVRGESVFLGNRGEQTSRGIDGLPDSAFAPDELAAFSERCQAMMTALDDPTLSEIATLRLEGYEMLEIAAKLNVSDRTVKRKLAIIRETWRRENSTE